MDKKQILAYWRNVRQLTLKLLDQFPAESFDFRPAQEVMTVSQQFRHILEVELFIRNGFLEGNWRKPTELGSNFFEKEMIRDRLRFEHEKTQSLLGQVPDGKFMKIFDTPFGPLTGELLVHVAVNEEIHHRGNLYTYLRCLGKTPPQMRHDYSDILKERNDV